LELNYITVPGGTAMKKDYGLLEEDWSVVTSFLPEGWEGQAKKLGAYYWSRGFGDPGVLLRTLLIHLVEGCSFRQTAVMAKQGGLAEVSDVALLKRLRAAHEWFRWLAVGVMERWMRKVTSQVSPKGLRARIIDGTTVQEPGSTGTSWRLHYSIGLESLSCDEFRVTGPDVGESFKNFSVNPGDLMIGDRCYAWASAIAHVVERGGHVLVRAKTRGLALVDSHSRGFDVIKHLRILREGKVGDWDVWVRHGNQLIKGRICAVKKTSSAAEAARRKIKRQNKKKHGTKREVSPKRLEAAGYFFVFTTLGDTFTATEVLKIYAGRWQIELAFKRLKSLLRIGHLHKTSPESARAWLHGKILVAFLVTAMMTAGKSFSPWGYAIQCQPQNKPMHLEGDILHA
jgi:hypothetical protein